MHRYPTILHHNRFLPLYMHRLFVYLVLVADVFLTSVLGVESFNETLTLRPLVGGRVYAAFTFELASDASSIHHFSLLPRPLLQPVASLGVQELRLAMNKGRWMYEEWGSPAPGTLGDDGVAIGAEVWASINNDTEMWPRWRVLTSALASVSCASLDAIDETTTIMPNYPYFGTNSPVMHAYLTSESVCTENISPLLKLLPCKGGAGLASLIKPHSILQAEFHGVSLHVLQKNNVWHVTIRVHVVKRPSQRQDTRWTMNELFSAQLEKTCPVSTSSQVHVQSPTVPEPAVQSDESLREEQEWTWDDEEDKKPLPYTVPMFTYTYDTHAYRDKGLNVAFVSNATSPLLRPPPLRASRQVLGHGQEDNKVRLTLRNDMPAETVHVMYYEHLPPTVLPLLHTLHSDAQVDDYDEADDMVRFRDDVTEPFVVNATYKPPKVRRIMGFMELELRVPAASTLTVTYTLKKHMLHYDEHIPDPHRGMDLPPAMFTPLGAHGTLWSQEHRHLPVYYVQAPHLYTAPGLIDMVLPDFSMPYNVILFYSTFVALFFGTMLNHFLRRYRDVYVKSRTTQ